jgi:F-type H+-transporting ATPase subunit delta
MAKLAANTYAQSIFEIGLELGKLELFHSEFKMLSDSFNDNPDFIELFRTPKLTSDNKKKVIEEVFGSSFSLEMINFLKILFDKNRSALILEIIEEFEKLRRKENGISIAYITSVNELSSTEFEKLKDQLESLTSNKIEIVTRIDKALIGGLLIKIDDKVIDGTVKNKLENLKENLRHAVV